MTRKLLMLVGAMQCVAVAGFAQPKPDLADIKTVQYRQCQAIPNFDCSVKTENDATRLAALKTILVRDATQSRQGEACPGGLRTTMTISFVDGKQIDLDLHACGGSHSQLQHSQLQDDVTALVSSWRH